MKKLILILMVALFLINCGTDGSDGDAFLSYSWDYYVDGFYDENPDIPETITEGVDYRTDPGSYYFEYYCSDGYGNYWYFTGTYSIEIEEGEEAELFADGEDGEDLYYTLDLDGLYGPDLYVYKSTNITKEKNIKLSNEAVQYENYQKSGEPIVDVFTNGNYSVIVEKQMYVKVK